MEAFVDAALAIKSLMIMIMMTGHVSKLDLSYWELSFYHLFINGFKNVFLFLLTRILNVSPGQRNP